VKLTLKRKIYGVAILAAVLPLLTTLILVTRFQARISADADRELTDLAKANITQAARDVHNILQTANDLLEAQVDHNLNVAVRILSERGGVRTAGPAETWELVDPVTRRPRAVQLPRLLVGGQWLGRTRSMQATVPFVDETQRLVGGAVTVFQRINEQGDMLRVATNVPATDGQRAIGTYISASQADGSPYPAIAAVLRNQTYHGSTFVANTWYVAAYEPLREGGKIIGMLVVGEKIEGLQTLRRNILSMIIGHSGYVSIVGATGEARGLYIISKGGERDGENIWDARDTTGRSIVQDEIRNTMALPRGGVLVDSYSWQNPGESRPRVKLVALMYFEPWGWLINASIYEDDYGAAIGNVRSSVRSMLFISLLGGLAALVFALAAAFFVGGRLSRPLEVATRLANRIAAGDLAAARSDAAILKKSGNGHGHIQFADESDELMKSIGTMTVTLESLIGQVQRSGIQVTTSATEISASARQLEATVAEQAASTRQVSATTTQISQTSTQLLKTMDGVSRTVGEAATCAESGHTELGGMETAMRQLAKSTSSISSRLGAISDHASKISTVVTAINKISDQTALLSLNAAIEAEKAGEFGKGFSVVAREISRLADQTASATQDIEAVVREMQTSVTSGVMEMDKFSEEVRRRVDDVNTIADQLGAIIDHVRELGPEFENAQQEVNAQSTGAQQISEAMKELAQAADQNRESLTEFKGATGQLNAAVVGLQEQIARFNVGA
jgi:methyl-accepting chemotaxis protein WspA